jgi:hypothetical protein
MAQGQGLLEILSGSATSLALAAATPTSTVDSTAAAGMRILELVKESAVEIGLTRTPDRIARFKEYLEDRAIDPATDNARLEAEARALREALDDDLTERMAFFPDQRKLNAVGSMGEEFDFASLYANIWDGHNQVIKAQSCYLTDNDPACVYHAMGAAEYGLRALAKRLRIKQPMQATWGILIKNLRNKIEELQGTTKSTKRNERLDFYSSLLDQCVFFNEHWRKSIAHLPKEYTGEEALNALRRSAGFLKTLVQHGMKLKRQQDLLPSEKTSRLSMKRLRRRRRRRRRVPVRP